MSGTITLAEGSQRVLKVSVGAPKGTSTTAAVNNRPKMADTNCPP